jgi:AcrR family transcriptional regulator
MQQQHAYDRRFEDALDSAEVLFAEKGFHAASMRDIARAAGVSVAGLYYYLPSKQATLYLVCNRVFDRLEAAARAVSPTGDPRRGLETFVRNHLRYMIENRHAYRVLLHDMKALEGDFREKLRARRRRYFSLLSDLVGRLQTKGASVSARLAAAALFGMLNWAPTWYRRELDGGADELADRLLALFLRGFSAPALALAEAGT